MDMFSQQETFVTPVRFVILRTSEHFGVSIKDIFDDVRKPEIAQARFAAYYLARELVLPQPGLMALARAFKRDHASVHHGIQRAHSWLLDNEVYRSKVNPLRDRLERELRAADALRCRALAMMVNGAEGVHLCSGDHQIGAGAAADFGASTTV